MKLPFCKRSMFDRAIAQANKEMSALVSRHQRELDETKKDVADLVQRLTEVALVPNRDSSRFRLCVDINEHMVRDCLAWGNDNRWIDYFAESIGHKVWHELKSANLVRYRDEEYSRGYGGWKSKESPVYFAQQERNL